MIMQTVNLYDRIEMDRTEDGVTGRRQNLPFCSGRGGKSCVRAESCFSG